MKKRIAILGSTGTIGKTLLKIVEKDKKNFQIILLTANKNYKLAINQAKKFNVKNLIITDPDSFKKTQKICENAEFVCIHRFSRIANKDVFYEVLTAITYKNGKVITQQMVRQELDYDPSEGQDWNWEDYE